jgi:hypothetical protein
MRPKAKALGYLFLLEAIKSKGNGNGESKGKGRGNGNGCLMG